MNRKVASKDDPLVRSGSQDLDPITIELVRNNLLSICQEMAESLIRSSHSPNIKERKDCSCGIYTDAGEMAVQAEHIPIHLGVMPHALRHILRVFPTEEMRPGDTFLVNDPYYGGNHLPDLILAGPLFLEGRHVGFAASLGHHNDVGGMAPRSMPAAAVEIFQEGLRIPPVKFASNWRIDDNLLRMIACNSRTPSERFADLRAQMAVAKLAQQRLEEVGRRYSADQISGALAELLRRSEAAMRAIIRGLPEGSWRGESLADFNGELIAIRAQLTKADDTLVIDFGGTEGSTPSPFNSCLSNTYACVYMAFRVALARDVPPNAGLYKPLDIRVEEGTILNPRYPAAVSAATQVSYHTFEALMRAFEAIAPNCVFADSGGAGVFSFGGVDPRSRQMFAYGEAIGGGSGASPHSDGESAVMPPVSYVQDTPVEALEMTLPLRIERYELLDGSGGAGRYQGGLGFRRTYRMMTPVRCSFQVSMAHRPPQGLAGGSPGRSTRIVVRRGDGREELIDGFTEAVIDAGDLVVVESAGGGGYGPASERAADHTDVEGR